MKEKQLKTSRIYFHFLFWITYFGIELCIEIVNNIFNRTSLVRYFLGIILFYIILEILNKMNIYIKISLIILSFFAFLTLSLYLKYWTFNLFQTFINPPISVQILYVIDNYAHLFFIAFIYNIFQTLIKAHKEAISIENQLVRIEIYYLDSKIDTHFFLNSINLFYSHFIKKDTEVALKLLKLSDFVKKNL